MGICVVITAFNNEGTILESTESVLSQARYPEQIGFSHGPSRDSTEEFAEFYREEFDFVHWDSRISAPDCGLMHLRLGALSDVTTSHVMFVRANSYLYRDALERIEGELAGADLVTAPVQFMAPDGNDWLWDVPDSPDKETLFQHGPVPPSAVIWKVSLLKDVFGTLQASKLGPFSTLGWLLAIRETAPDLVSLDEPLVETWDFRRGNHCWTRGVYSTLHTLLENHEVDARLVTRIQAAIGESHRPHIENGSVLAGLAPPSGEPSDHSEVPWVDNRYPMVE